MDEIPKTIVSVIVIDETIHEIDGREKTEHHVRRIFEHGIYVYVPRYRAYYCVKSLHINSECFGTRFHLVENTEDIVDKVQQFNMFKDKTHLGRALTSNDILTNVLLADTWRSKGKEHIWLIGFRLLKCHNQIVYFTIDSLHDPSKILWGKISVHTVRGSEEDVRKNYQSSYKKIPNIRL